MTPSERDHHIKTVHQILSGHAAIVGMSGSGKTSTIKRLIEDAQSRFCILDPIKSDYYGLTLMADGKTPGMNFTILGGPYGHAPLHPEAGAAIAEVVASGALQRCIIDMADFPMGGANRFFIAFMDTLLKRNRGVLNLVLEEAHEFAPKERSGQEKENMALFYAKKAATAGRSKGLRTIVSTQRTQQLHNSLLGSAEVVVAHKLLAPADQKPVVDMVRSWHGKPAGDEVQRGLSALKKGEAFVIDGTGYYRHQFPMIHTYDNTRTPDGNEELVKVPPVDVAALTSLIGEAVKEAEANDPKKLREEIAALKAAAAKGVHTPVADPIAHAAAVAAAREEGRQAARSASLTIHRELTRTTERISTKLQELSEELESHKSSMTSWQTILEAPPAAVVPFKAAPIDWTPPPPHPRDSQPLEGFQLKNVVVEAKPLPTDDGALSKMGRTFLTVLAQRGAMTKGRLLLHAGYASSGPVSKCFAALAAAGFMESESGTVAIRPAGLKALGTVEPLPTGSALRDKTLRELSTMEAALLNAWFAAYPRQLTKSEVLKRTGYASSGPVSKAFAKLNGRGFIIKRGQAYVAAEEFFAA